MSERPWPPEREKRVKHKMYMGKTKTTTETNNKWVGYDFRWIEDIGIQMIKSIEINCGSTLIQKYSGSYLLAMVERDFTNTKKELFHKMSGNTCELNDPANAHGRENAYPSTQE